MEIKLQVILLVFSFFIVIFFCPMVLFSVIAMRPTRKKMKNGMLT